jgi:putative DNA primase/helicase
LIDEADTFFNENEELRGVMNSGHTKQLAYVIRTVDIGGGVFEPRQFSTWAPKAVAGIRRLADTFEDRSIIVELKRKLPGEHTERIAKFNGATIRRKLTRWARDNFEAIKCADPQLPAGVYNRLADNWLPLLAITELAGAEWTDRATKALLSGMDNDSRTESAGVMLLSDLRALFNERPDPAYLATRDILEYLHDMDDRPWSAFGKFLKPITSEGMARLLKPFKIKPGQISEINARGYYLKDLKDTFDRYIPKKIPLTPIGEGDNLHTCINQDETRVTENSNLHKVNQTNAGTDPPVGAPDKEVCRYASRKGEDIDINDVSSPAQSDGHEINTVDGAV